MAITATQIKQHDAHRTPSAKSSLWFENPVEDPDDKKTPTRVRDILGDYYILVEQVAYETFPPPEVRAALKAAGKKVFPIYVEQYYIHVMHSKWLTPRTFKVYKHQGKYFYSDSVDYASERAIKSPPPKDRDTMLDLFKNVFKLPSRVEASRLLSSWTCGN